MMKRYGSLLLLLLAVWLMALPTEAARISGASGTSGLPTPGSDGDCLTVSGSNWVSAACPTSGAPTGAKYITQTADGTLSAEQALGALGTGLVINTTTTGVLSIYAGQTCTNQVIRILSASGAATCATITSAFVDSSILVTSGAGTVWADPTIATTWADNVKQTFNPGADNAGLNVGAAAAEPGTPIAGDVFYDSNATAFKFYENGSWKGLGIAAEADTLQTVFARDKEITGANSEANCLRIGDGVNYGCFFWDSVDGWRVTTNPIGDLKLWIPTNKNYVLFDQEGAAAIETVNPDAASTLAMWTYGAAYRPKKSIWYGAGSMSTDGTQCASPAEATPLANSVKLWTIICADNDASRMHGSLVMPDSWDGGTLTFSLTYIQTAADTSAFKWTVAAQCIGTGETLLTTANYGTAVDTTDAAVTGSSAQDTTVSTAVTPAGTCAAGDFLAFYIDVDATGTTTGMTTFHIVGTKIEYSITSRSD